jgi:hypothetical protein
LGPFPGSFFLSPGGCFGPFPGSFPLRPGGCFGCPFRFLLGCYSFGRLPGRNPRRLLGFDPFGHHPLGLDSSNLLPVCIGIVQGCVVQRADRGLHAGGQAVLKAAAIRVVRKMDGLVLHEGRKRFAGDEGRCYGGGVLFNAVQVGTGCFLGEGFSLLGRLGHLRRKCAGDVFGVEADLQSFRLFLSGQDCGIEPVVGFVGHCDAQSSASDFSIDQHSVGVDACQFTVVPIVPVLVEPQADRGSLRELLAQELRRL